MKKPKPKRKHFTPKMQIMITHAASHKHNEWNIKSGHLPTVSLFSTLVGRIALTTRSCRWKRMEASNMVETGWSWTVTELVPTFL